jgi:hypothetical protein
MDDLTRIAPENESKSVEVTYKFYIPENQEELDVFINAYKFQATLSEIYNECRRIWKYDEKASDELIAFAEKIGGMCSEVDVTF